MANGDDEASTGTGFTRYVTTNEFKQYGKTNDKDHKRINLALWGEDGRDGLVKSMNDVTLQQKILIGVLVFVQPIVFAVILKWLGI